MIRITSDGCPYCGRDRGQYVRLAREAARAGCRVVALAPRIGMMALRGDEPALQLQYVDMKLGRALNPFFTPQTVVLDGEGRVGWQRQGAMGDRDLALALETLAAFPHRSRVSPDHDGATRAGRLQQ
jgi:hypothetical protein